MIIAIDGPAASGKSSTARAVARELGFHHLDSGAFYRAITLAAILRGIPPEDWERLDAAALNALRVDAVPVGDSFQVRVDDVDVSAAIRSPEVDARVSAMARVPAVRDWLLGSLRAAARHASLVADGRDIGTVVFPDADLKIFLVADPATRARRRLLQSGLPVDGAAIAEEVRRIEARDHTDTSRGAAPLRQAPDAIRLDTSALGFDEQVAAITRLARARDAERHG
jgi:cytidylate kinase